MTESNFTTEQKSIAGFDSQVVELLRLGMVTLQLDASDSDIEKLLNHLMLLEKWNRRLNLTAIVAPREMVIQHLLDSLSVLPHLGSGPVLDIGTGGGFPGLPIAVLLPNVEVCLLDARGKRVEFLRYAIGAVKVTNATAVHSRVEDYRPSQKFDTLVTRAFSSLHDMLNLTTSLHHSADRMLAMKGRCPNQEIDALPEFWHDRIAVQALEVPFLNAERHLVNIDLTGISPKQPI